MGQADRDYWHRDRPFTQARHETSFLSKLLITLAVLLMCAVAYRYQAEIKLWVQKSAERPAQRAQAPVLPAPAMVPAPAPAVPQNPHPETSGQIYRCGNTYSHEPCDNARQISIPTNASRDMSAAKEIYLCKDIYDRLTWESTPCSANGKFMDRIARVPANIPWEEQVAIARQQRDRAHAIAAEQVVAVASRPSSAPRANAGECQALDERVNSLDSLGRIGGGGYTMDWIREQRRLARDRQFRIGC